MRSRVHTQCNLFDTQDLAQKSDALRMHRLQKEIPNKIGTPNARQESTSENADHILSRMQQRIVLTGRLKKSYGRSHWHLQLSVRSLPIEILPIGQVWCFA